MTVPVRNVHRPVATRSGQKRFQPLQFGAVVRKRLTLAQWMFLIIVVAPTMLAVLYYGLIASDRYVSEASFIVRGANSQSAGGLGALLRSFGMSRADDDTYAVQDFLLSREAARQLNERMPLREVFSRPGTDWFTRFPAFWRRNTFESMYNYYLSRVILTYKSSTGITQLKVSAFRPEDARDVAQGLLKLSEELVNRLNNRAQRDAITHAQAEVEAAEKRVIDAQAAITTFRNRELLIDPTSTSAKSLEVIGKLAADLAQTRVQLQETQTSSPASPAIQGLRVRVASLQNQISLEQSKMAGKDDALASKMATYERLVLNREFADRELMLSSSAMELARQQARRQQIYLETIAAPHLPDESLDPRRWRGLFTVFILAMAVFSMAWFLIIGAREQLHG